MHAKVAARRTSPLPHWRRRLEGSPGVIDTAALQRQYDRTAGWALQRHARGSALLARYAGAGSEGGADPLLLARAPTALTPEDHVDAQVVTGATPAHRSASDRVEIGADARSAGPAAAMLAAHLQRRFDPASTIRPRLLPMLDRGKPGVAHSASLHQRLAARTRAMSPATAAPLPIARRLDPSAPDAGSATHASPRAGVGAQYPLAVGTLLGPAPVADHRADPLHRTVERSGSSEIAPSTFRYRPAATSGERDMHGAHTSAAADAPVGQQTFAMRRVNISGDRRPPVAPPRGTGILTLARQPSAIGHTATAHAPPTSVHGDALVPTAATAAGPATHLNPAIVEESAIHRSENPLHASERTMAAGLPAPAAAAGIANPESDHHIAPSALVLARRPDGAAHVSLQANAAPAFPQFSETSARSSSLLPLSMETAGEHHAGEQFGRATWSAARSSNGFPLAASTARDQRPVLARTLEVAAGGAPAPSLVWRRASRSVGPAENPVEPIMRRVPSDGAPIASTAAAPPSAVGMGASAVSPATPGGRAGIPDLNQLAEQVTRMIVRRLEVERDRRGGKTWI